MGTEKSTDKWCFFTEMICEIYSQKQKADIHINGVKSPAVWISAFLFTHKYAICANVNESIFLHSICNFFAFFLQSYNCAHDIFAARSQDAFSL